ncbi:MAG: MFS transporter [Chloroflexi bacterium]|nr:MFS transporter [Chloroflexota bacterium]
MVKTFHSFKIPAFRIYFFAMVGLMGAMNMQLMVRSLLAYRLTGSAAILGGVALAYSAPMLFVSLFGGVIADRLQKKYILAIGSVGSALVALSIALALSLGYLSAERAGSWWILAVAGAVEGTVNGLVMPTRQAILPEIIGKGSLLNAVSLGSLERDGLRFLAPAAAGFVIDRFGFETVYFIMVGLNLMAMLFCTLLPRSNNIASRGNVFSDIKAGLQYIRHETIIFVILLFTLITVILSMPYQTLLPIFTDSILKVGATGMGILMSFSGIGAVAGSFTFASLPNKKRGFLMLISSLILGITLTIFSFSSSWPLSLSVVVLLGLGQSGRVTLASTLLQYYSKPEYHGRVMSIFMMEAGLSAFATFMVALLADVMGVQWSLGGFAILLVIVSVVMLLFVPRLRKLD